MTAQKPLAISFLSAVGVTIYVAAVALVMQNGEKIFGREKSLAIPIVFLLLFVLSAAITGSLVLGRPVLLYLEGLKTEAIKLFLFTLGWLVLIMAMVLTVQIIF